MRVITGQSPGNLFSAKPPDMNSGNKGNPGNTGIFGFNSQTELPMKRDLEMLNSLFEYATEGIVICNSQGEIRLANPARRSARGRWLPIIGGFRATKLQ